MSRACWWASCPELAVPGGEFGFEDTLGHFKAVFAVGDALHLLACANITAILGWAEITYVKADVARKFDLPSDNFPQFESRNPAHRLPLHTSHSRGRGTGCTKPLLHATPNFSTHAAATVQRAHQTRSLAEKEDHILT